MGAVKLYCQDCGRKQVLHARPEGLSLGCPACGGPLADQAPARQMAPPRDAFLGQTIGGARLKRLLARHPSRAVYLGFHKQLGMDVRVEVFPADFAEGNADYVRRLFSRAALTRQIRAPEVASLLDLGRRPNCWFIASEYLPRSLRQVLEKEGRLRLDAALPIVAGVLRALISVEGVASTHGNVSPEGIFLGYDGAAKLTHLGTTLRPQELNSLTVTPGGTVTGPAFYAAPERVADEQAADIRSDLYSLGVTAYEMLSGSKPYEGTGAQEVMARHAQAPPADLRQARPDLPEPVCRFVARLMAVDPSQRPAGARQALEELEQCAADLVREGHLRPADIALPPVRRLVRSARRGGFWVLIGLLLIVAALVPPVLLHQEKARAKAAREEPAVAVPLAVLVVVGGSDAASGPELARQARAVRTMLTFALARYAGLAAIDPAYTDELLRAGEGVAQVQQQCRARCLLMATVQAGFRRRNWALSFVNTDRKGWIMQAQGAVEDASANDLSALERAADELLDGAASRLGLKALSAAPALPVADADAWAEVAGALEAEQEGRWDEALACSRRAEQEAPDAAPFAFLSAFYATVGDLTGTGQAAAAGALPAGGLPPEMAALAGVLDALARDEERLVRERFGDCLAEFPHSARGYFLLGFWLQHREQKAPEALVALRHAVDLDPLYMPAARACVELLAERGPDKVPAFLRAFTERVPGVGRADRLRAYADSLLQRAQHQDRP
jgi:tetratricopeptide (TPR) repeat protein